MAHLHAARPEPMNASPTHPKVKVTLKLPPSPHSSSGPPLFVAGEAVTGKLEVECKTEDGLGLSVIGVEVFGVQELTSRDHSALSPFLHTRRLFQGPGLPPSNAVKPFPPPNSAPLPPNYHHARRGISTFLFRIPVPRSCPASVNLGGGIAKVRYEVRAWVGVCWKGERREVVGRREVEVVESWVDGDEEEEREEVVVAENGKIWMQAKVLGGVIVAGESACVELQVKNHSTKRNSGLSISLKQALHLPTPPSSPELGPAVGKPPIQISDTLRTIHFRGPEYVVPPGVEGVASLVFDVPRYVRSVRGGMREGPEVIVNPNGGVAAGTGGVHALFEVKCLVNVKMNMGIGSKDISLSIPVRVVHPAALPEIELAPEDTGMGMAYPHPLSPGVTGSPGIPGPYDWQGAYSNGVPPPGYAYPSPMSPGPLSPHLPSSPLPHHPSPPHPGHMISPLPTGIPLPLSPAPAMPFVENGYVYFPPVLPPQYAGLVPHAASPVQQYSAYNHGHGYSPSPAPMEGYTQAHPALVQPQPGHVIEPITPTRLEHSVHDSGERGRETSVQYHDTPPRPSSAGARSVLPVALDYSSAMGIGSVEHTYPHTDAHQHHPGVYPNKNETVFPTVEASPGREQENRASRLSRKLHETRKGRSVSPQRQRERDHHLLDMGPPSTSRINAANSISPSSTRTRTQTLTIPLSPPHFHLQTHQSQRSHGSQSPTSPTHTTQSSKLVSPRPLLSPKRSFTIDPVTKRETTKSEKVEELERMADAYPLDDASLHDQPPSNGRVDPDPNKTLPGPPVPTRNFEAGKKDGNQRVRVDGYFDLPKPKGQELEPDQPPTPTLMAVKKRPNHVATGKHASANLDTAASNGLLPSSSPNSGTKPNFLATPSTGVGASESGLDALERRLMRDVGTKKPDIARKRDVRDILGPLTSSESANVGETSRKDKGPGTAGFTAASTGPPSPLPSDESAISSLTLAGDGARDPITLEVDDEDDGKTQKGGSKYKHKPEALSMTVQALNPTPAVEPAALGSSSGSGSGPHRHKKKRDRESGHRSGSGHSGSSKDHLTKKAAAKGRVAEWLGAVEACEPEEGVESLVRSHEDEFELDTRRDLEKRGRSRSREPPPVVEREKDPVVVDSKTAAGKVQEEKDIKDLLREEDERLGLLTNTQTQPESHSTSPDPRSSGFVPIGSISKNTNVPGSIILGNKAAPAGSFLVRGTANGSVILRGMPSGNAGSGAMGNGSIVVRGPGGSTRIFRVTDPRSEARRIAEIWARRVESVEEKQEEKPLGRMMSKGKPTTAAVLEATSSEVTMRNEGAKAKAAPVVKADPPPAPAAYAAPKATAVPAPARPILATQNSKPTPSEPKPTHQQPKPNPSDPKPAPQPSKPTSPEPKTSKPTPSNAALGVARFPKPAVPTSARLTKPLGTPTAYPIGSPPKTGTVSTPKTKVEMKATTGVASPGKSATALSSPKSVSSSSPLAVTAPPRVPPIEAQPKPVHSIPSSSPLANGAASPSAALLTANAPSYDVRSARGGRGGKVTAVTKVFSEGAASAPTVQSPVGKKSTTPDNLPKPVSPLKVSTSSKPSTSPPTQSLPSASTSTAAPRKRSFPSAAPGLLKSSSASVPAVLSASHAKPMLSSTASLARPLTSGARSHSITTKPATTTIVEEESGDAKLITSKPGASNTGAEGRSKPGYKPHPLPGNLGSSKSSGPTLANVAAPSTPANLFSPTHAAPTSPTRAVPSSPVVATSLSAESREGVKLDLAFGQNRLKELIKKYQNQAAS